MCQIAYTKPVYLQIYTDFCTRYFQTIKSDESHQTTGLLKGSRKKSNFVAFSETDSRKFLGANFADKTIGKKQLISREFSGQILLEIDRFYTDLTSVFNVF